MNIAYEILEGIVGDRRYKAELMRPRRYVWGRVQIWCAGEPDPFELKPTAIEAYNSKSDAIAYLERAVSLMTPPR